MNYDHLVHHFAGRTLKNLAVIKKHHETGDVEVYEVTQLINSALGLVVMPRKRFLNEIPDYTLAEPKAKPTQANQA